MQKQYKILDNLLKEEIDNKTKMWNLSKNNFGLNNLLDNYNIEEIIRLVFEIPKKSWDLLEYKIIDKILENGTKER